jgi:hypothetical protein
VWCAATCKGFECLPAEVGALLDAALGAERILKDRKSNFTLIQSNTVPVHTTGFCAAAGRNNKINIHSAVANIMAEAQKRRLAV